MEENTKVKGLKIALDEVDIQKLNIEKKIENLQAQHNALTNIKLILERRIDFEDRKLTGLEI